jgi:IS5 family transposase
MTARQTETVRSARGQTTLCRFRAALAERGVAEALFAELNRQLDARGLVLKAGTLIDATLVEAAVARPPQSEGEVSTKDPEAGFTRCGQRSFFGAGSHRSDRCDGDPSRRMSRSISART